MSGILVKNLPKYVTEDRLRDVFSQKGEITDVKLKRLRQFAYIGFRNEQEAQAAITYFNKSFIDTLKISVEVAKPPPKKEAAKVNDNGEHSYYAKGDKKIRKKPEADHDPQLLEFLQCHSVKLWSNDTCIPPSTGVSFSNGADDPNKAKRPLLDTKKTTKNKVGDDVSDMEYFKSRITKSNLSDSDCDYETDCREDAIRVFPIDGEYIEADRVDHAMEVEADGKMAQELKTGDSDDVLGTGRLFVHNLPYTTTEEELTEHFSKFGEISEVHLVLDRETKRSKGRAYILYLIPESAVRAIEELDDTAFQGRLLHILPAKPREKSDKQVNDSCNLPKTFKQKREEQRKTSEALGNTKAWNSLFMRPDTILENIVRMFGVKKSELLDRECENPAVNLAMAETKVIMETKEALAKAGVRVTSLEEFAAGKGDEKNRSNHILLVKNLPFASTEKELAQKFGKFGSLDKIVLPPTKTVALVVFLEPAEAREAMKKMAYTRYKGSPLYLEWAPGDILEPKALPDNKEKKSDVEEIDERRVNLDQQVGIYSDISESNVLYVKNLNFETTDESLKKHFTELVKQGKILSVKIIKEEKNGKSRLSSGYGFVEFDSIETASRVYEDLQGITVLDGHKLILSYSQNKRSETVGKASDKDKTLTKLSVKNVPFEATEKEVRQLFSPFGQIKSVGYPKKNGEFRGYCSIDFGTNQEALNAKEALSSTHFYNRHLVVDWKREKSVEAIGKACAAKYVDQENDNPKKRKRSAAVGERRMKFERNS